MKIRIAGITEDSIVDGPGLRLTVFVQGCPHHCIGCHNPETWDYHGGMVMDTNDIIAMMDANPLIDGITLSGGEPIMQLDACCEIAKAAKNRGLNVWCYTGFTWSAKMHRHIPLIYYVDVLVDGLFVMAERTLELPWRGSKNQRLIDVKKSLKAGKIVEYEL